MTEIRYKIEFRKYTFWRRFRIWRQGIWDALLEIPPDRYAEYIQLKKGDAGYEEAHWKFETNLNPLRYTLGNGEWKHVKTQTVEPNAS